MTAEQIETRLREIAPPPEWGTTVTPRDLARYLAVCADLGFCRNVTPFIRDDQEIPASLLLAEFTAAHALLALAEAAPEAAAETVRRIVDAWADGNSLGAYLWADLTELGVNPAEVEQLDRARLALDGAAPAEPSPVADAESLEAAASVLERRFSGTRPEVLDSTVRMLHSLARAWRRDAGEEASRG
jgi:hypothetical protein